MFLGRPADPRWARPLLWVLLIGTAALYLVDLSISGYANEFYAAAVKSGTESWKAWLFGSLDSSNAITVDKPPASLWLMGLSGRIFGFSSFSMLLPDALCGIGTVALAYGGVKRWSGHAAGLIAGALIALTPVAALMFRFNNPDATLVFLMTLAAYFTVRAIEGQPNRKGRSTALRFMVLVGVTLGFAFLTKMFQGLLVVPGFALAYLVAAPGSFWLRLRNSFAALGGLIVGAGWFVALVELWPAGARPYIGGSTDNSLWELAIGYNGISRILGGDGNGGGGGGTSFGGSTGLTRMFGSSFGTEISWMLPAALIGLVAGLWFTLRLPRTDRSRASLIIWGGWLVITALVLSYMSGTVHPYYSVALAPAIAATIAVSGVELWRGRAALLPRIFLALMIAATGAWSFYLLKTYAADWLPWLRWVGLIGALAGAALFAAGGSTLKRLTTVALLVGVLTSLGGTTAYTIATASTAHTGSIPTSGPAGYSTGGMGGGFGGSGTRGAGGAGGTGGAPTGTAPTGSATGAGTGGTATTTSSTSDLTTLLEQTTSRWAAATVGSSSAETYILSTDKAVMAIGGFTGSDNSPTLAQFKAYVAAGDISYFIVGGGMGGGGGQGGGTSSASAITSWVESTFKSETVGGVTVYVLTSSTAS